MSDLTVPKTDTTMTSSSIAGMLGKEKKEVNRLIRTMFEDKIDGVDSPPCIYVEKDHRGYVIEYHVPELESKMFVAKYDMGYLEQITQFWIDNNASQALSLPQTYPEALRELADSQEQLALAVSTKAEIGNRREATAMNTASQATKKANRLEQQLDKSKEYSSIKRMEIVTGEKFNWRLLKSTAIALDKPIIKIPDPNFEEVNAYHYTVWLEAYNLEIA